MWKSAERLRHNKADLTQAARDALTERGLREEATRMRREEADYQREVREIEERAKADGTYMKAPNGKPTNLDERQWAHVRSSRFKQWFGDWEQLCRAVNIVEGTRNHGFKNFTEARAWAKSSEGISRLYTDKETGGKGNINISKSAVDKFLQQNAVEKSGDRDVHLAVLRVLGDVLRESVDAEQHPDYKKGADGVRRRENGINPNVTIHRLYGAVNIEGKTYRVKITVKEDDTSHAPMKTHSYEATKIELQAGTLGNSEAGLSPDTNNSISGAKLLGDVEKSYSNGEKLLDGISKVVDENGEPLVIYHGTPEFGFTVFDKEYSDDKHSIFFTADESVARSYASVNAKIRSLNDSGEAADRRAILDAFFEEQDLGMNDPYDVYAPLFYASKDLEIEVSWNEERESLEIESLLTGQRLELNDETYDFDTLYDWLLENSSVENMGDAAAGIYPVFLNAKRVLTIDAGGSLWGSIPSKLVEGYEGKYYNLSTRGISEFAEDKGYDAVRILDILDTGGRGYGAVGDSSAEIWISLNDKSVVKSATDNVGTYDSRNDDIRFRIGRKRKEEYWNVNSAGVFRRDYSKKKEVVWTLPTIGSSANADTAGVKHGATKGAAVTSENSPQTTSSATKIGENSNVHFRIGRKQATGLTKKELDRAYFDALERKDMAYARQLVDEAARRAGYIDTESAYQARGTWAAPGDPGYETKEERRAALETGAPDVNLEDIAEGYNLVNDSAFTNPRVWGNGRSAREAISAITTAVRAIKDGRKITIKVYRAVPNQSLRYEFDSHEVKEDAARNGDWVTPSKSYAIEHGEGRFGSGKYRIIEQEVEPSDLWWDGNDIREWGFDDGKEYRYQNTKNNRKLNTLVTYDDNGNIIPLSKRFNKRTGDTRFRIGEPYDYEAYPFGRVESGLSGKEVSIVDVPRHQYKGRLQDALKEVKRWARENIVGTLTDEETGGKGSIEISGTAIGKLLSESALKKSSNVGAHVSALLRLPEIIRASVFVESHPDFRKVDGERKVENGIASKDIIHRLYGAITIDGDVYRVKTTLKELSREQGQSTAHTYEVTEIELLDASSETTQEGGNQHLKRPNNSIPLAKLLDGVEMSYKKGVKILDESRAISSTTLRDGGGIDSAVPADGRTAEEKRQRAVELGEQLGERVEFVEEVTDEMLASLPEKQREKARTAKGWYDEKTGKVVVIGGNHADVADVEATIFHEVVGHKGMEGLLGKERYDKLCERLGAVLAPEQRERVKEYEGSGERALGDEYIARVAEELIDAEGNIKEPTTWAKVKGAVREFFRDAFGLDLTDADIKYLLWKSAERLRHSKADLTQAARDVLTERRLREEATNRNDDIRFRIGRERKEEMKRGMLTKLTNASEEQVEQTVSEIEKLGEQSKQGGDPKVEKAALHWAMKGTILLPEDNGVIRQAVDLTDKYHIDFTTYNNPRGLIEDVLKVHPDESEKPVNPDYVPTLRNKHVLQNGITIYDVDDGRESQQNVRCIIDTHFGRDAQPWCLFDTRFGRLTESAKSRWDKGYDLCQRRIAFKDGRLISFCANDQSGEMWWDRNDNPSLDIPRRGKIVGDKLGRTATLYYSPKDGSLVEGNYSDITRGQKNGENATYEEWHDLENIAYRAQYDDEGYQIGYEIRWEVNGAIEKLNTYSEDGYGLKEGLCIRQTDLRPGEKYYAEIYYRPYDEEEGLYVDETESNGFAIHKRLTNEDIMWLADRLKDADAEELKSIQSEDNLLAILAERRNTPEGGQRNPVLFRSGGSSLEEVNRRYNEQLQAFTPETADQTIFQLGRPSAILVAAGVVNKPLKLHGSKLAAKMKKHGFEAKELLGLPRALAKPIAVFDNLGRRGNRSVLVELRTTDGNFLVTIDIGKGADIDFDVVSSVFGKSDNKIVHWLNKGLATYIDKKKALNYLYLSAPIAEAASNQELLSAAKVIEAFENPKQKASNFRDGGGIDSAVPADGRTAEEKRQRAVELGEQLGERVEFVEEATDEMLASLPEKQREKARTAKGWYDKKTGKVVVIATHTRRQAALVWAKL